jgi:hypothetical protein
MWNFSKMPPKSVQRNVKTNEFFSEGKGTAESLVRETLQNCLDAKHAEETHVRVAYSIHTVSYHDFESQWMPGLRKHLEALGGNPREEANEEGGIRVLVIEDFNTTGLHGSLVEDDGNPYFTFWWKEGSSSKAEEHGGRHGVGKSVLWSASKLRFFFGLTVRRSDGRHLLTGQAALRPHKISDEGYEPYGHFESQSNAVTHSPFEAPNTKLEDFRSFFKLSRSDECGLSIVIPFLDGDITEDFILDAVVGDAFHQVAEGKLSVKVGPIEVSRQNLMHVAASRRHNRALVKAIELSQSVVRDPLANVEHVECGPDCDQLTSDLFPGEALQRLRNVWAAQGRVGVSVSLSVRHAKSGSGLGRVCAYIQRASEDGCSSATFVRGRITVPLSGCKPGHDVAALLIVCEGPLSTFLGDAEKPNHRDWIIKQAESKGYKNAVQVIRFCKSLLPQLYRIVNNSDQPTVLKGVLSDVFPRPGASVVKADGVLPPLPPNGPAAIDIERRDGGFVVRIPAKIATQISFRVRASYASRSGSLDWDPLDFSFTKSPIKCECKGPGDLTASAGMLNVVGAAGGFTLTVTGFDRHRDLIVVAEAEQEEVA